ncbi:MAG TPA: hypothetical protein VGI58_17915 [Streptosporangiaceae bacterium]|jgi:hypothetical protein
MPFASIPQAEQATSRDKRLIIAIGAGILAVVVAVGIWVAVRPGSYDSSRNGCITVNIPNTMGGSVQHACGTTARTMCDSAFAATDRVSLLTRPQCRLAGLGPSQTTSQSGG